MFGTYVPGVHGLSNDPNSTIGSHMVKGYTEGTNNKQHRRTNSVSFTYQNQDTVKDLERILEPDHKARKDMNASFYMRGQRFVFNPYQNC
jgi:hypothetical protein